MKPDEYTKLRNHMKIHGTKLIEMYLEILKGYVNTFPSHSLGSSLSYISKLIH